MDQQKTESKRGASSTTSGIAAKSQETAEQLKEAVVEQVNQIRDQAQSAKDRTTDRIRGVATQLRGVGDTLRQDDPLVARLADRASDGAESLARYVGASTPQSFVRDAESLARRQPTLFFGGAFLLGLAAGRFLKSSAPSTSTPGGWRGYDTDEHEGVHGRSSASFRGDETPTTGRNRSGNRQFERKYPVPDNSHHRTAGVQAGVKNEFGSPPPVPRTNDDRTADAANIAKPSSRGNLP